MTPRHAFSAFGVSLIAFSTPCAAAPQILDYPQGGVLLKNGWNTQENRKTPQLCVEGDVISDAGMTTDVDYKEVIDTSSLMDAFGFSASAKVSALGGAASASVKFSKEVKVETTGTNIAVRVLTLRGAKYVVPIGAGPSIQATLTADKQRTLEPKSLDRADLKLDAIHLTARAKKWAISDPWRFHLECGDSYVSAHLVGTGINGLVAADTRSEQEKTALRASFSGSYGPVSGQADVSQDIQTMASSSRLHITYHQIGGANLEVANTLSSFNDIVRTIGPKAYDANGTPIYLEARPYTELADFTPPPEFTLVTDMVNEYFRLFTVRDLTTDVITNPTQYILGGPVDIASVSAVGSKIGLDMDALFRSISECSQTLKRGMMNTCILPPNVPLTDYIYRAHLPLRKVDGQPYRDMQSLYNELTAAERNLKSTPIFVKESVCAIGIEPFCVKYIDLNKSNPAYTFAQQKVTDLKRQIAAKPEVFDDIEMRYKIYVAYPAQIRCREHVDNNGCVVGNELNSLRDEVSRKFSLGA